MSERNDGMYYPDGSYKTSYQIRAKDSAGFVATPNVAPTERSFEEWTLHAEHIRQMKRQILPLAQNIDVHFGDELPKLIAYIGDPHIGGETDYPRLRDDVAAVRDTDGAHAVLLGDVVDGMFFSSGSTQDRLMSLNEEAYMAKAMCEELRGKMLAAWVGDHDDWSSARGLNMYHEFQERYETTLMQGIGYMDFFFEDPDDPAVRSAAAHRHPGFSIYSHTAASERLQRESAQECDLVATAHNHRKGISEKTIASPDGPRQLLFVSVGPYKMTDGWLRKQGYAQQSDEMLGGIGVILHPDGNKEAYWSIEDGVTKLENLSTI